MILKQFYLNCLAHASYLIADRDAKVAAVVDPQRDIDEYAAEAERLGVRIRYVLLTHFHADFVAGHLELRERYGATIYVGAQAKPEYEHVALADGDTLEFGNVRIEALETPGHTPEGVSYVVYDLANEGGATPPVPHAVLTGDTLFIGDVGRPDLLGSIGYRAEDLASMLYDSLHDKLLALPDATLVYPAHGAGSMCGKNLSSETVSTIGAQRASNYALQPMTREEFVALVASGQPQAPRYFLHDAVMNRKERAILDDTLGHARQPLTLDRVLQLQRDGAQVIDVRDDTAVGIGTMRGAMHISLTGSFATWAGSLLALDRPIVVLADPGQELEAMVRLARVGIDDVAGYVDGGFTTVASRPELVQRTRQITVDELRRRLESGEALRVLDVRTPGEWQQGHIEGAQHVPLIELEGRLAEVPTGCTVAVVCRTSNRSASAVSILRRHGHDKVLHVLGGMSKWNPAEVTA